MPRRIAGPSLLDIRSLSAFAQLLAPCLLLACVANKPAASEPEVTVRSALPLGHFPCPNNTTCNPLVQGMGTTGTGECCQEEMQLTCDQGRWPNGNVYYQFFAGNKDFPANTSAQNHMFRLAMTDWEDATNGMIHFIEGNPPQGGFPMVVRYTDDGGGVSYDSCHVQACEMGAKEGRVYHELGHTLLNFHYWQRYDRNHYMVLRDIFGPQGGGGNACDANTRCPNDGQRDLGPFDFKSTMLYSANYPGHTRYDGSRLCNPAVMNSCDGAVGCAGTPATRYNNCTKPEIACPPGASPPGCFPCSNNGQPYGPPTNNDGAAVIELYRNLAEPGWKRFRRTVNEDTSSAGAKQPFNYDLASGVTLATDVDPTPALATWGSGDLAILALGSNQHMYMKWKTSYTEPVTWGGWTDLGCCFNSAPSAVSWGNGRTDVVARGTDGAIYINSETPGAWTGWQSLGGSAGSAPAITSWGPNRLDVFAKASSTSDLMVKSCTANCSGASGTWGSWSTPFGGGLKGKPAAVSRGSGLIDIFVHGGDDKLYANSYNNGVPGTWTLISSSLLEFNSAKPDLYSPAAASRGSTYVEVFVRGAAAFDDKVSVITWQGSAWSSFKVLGGVLTSAPATISRVRDSSRADLAGVMEEEESYGNPPKSGVWWKEYSLP